MRPPQPRRAEDCDAPAGSLSFIDPPVLHILPSPALAPACPTGADEPVHGFEAGWETEFGEFIPSLDTIAGHYHPDRDGVDVARGHGVGEAEAERGSAEGRSYCGAGAAAAPSAEAAHLPSPSPSSSNGLKTLSNCEQHATSGATHGYVPAPPPQRVQEHRHLQGNQNRQQACPPRYNHPAAAPPAYHPPVEHAPPTAAAPFHSIAPPISSSPQRSQQDPLPLRPLVYKSPKLSVGYRIADGSAGTGGGYGGSSVSKYRELSTNASFLHASLKQDVERLVAPYPTSSCRVLYDGDGRSRGVGFARLLDRESALAVIAELNGRRIPGAQAPLQVRFADSLSQKKLKVAGKVAGNIVIGGKRATGSSVEASERAVPPRNRERQLRPHHGERSRPRDLPAEPAVRDCAPAVVAVAPPTPPTAAASSAASEPRSPATSAAGVPEGTAAGEGGRPSASPPSRAGPAVSAAEFDAYADRRDGEQQKPSSESDDPDRAQRTASADSGCATSVNQTPPPQKPQMFFLAADGSVRPYPPRYTSRSTGHGQAPKSERQDMERQVQQLSIHQAEVSAK
ncbi:MAG: hypothetical protein BJ554DRAFT_4047 [Olpidium bornovanus]|uniref:RRM domain-containing protein n=1 Tax=Olpidium bornovanus TaxID=278681 RepID=A0A8H7ZNB2_9FUNG|nr:MAG: hypothetical protein BJ554DRAFT_4047 [Olpidium bornovanus]